ncbi:hypothetical protein MtrunA17_Chr5g0417881 [Medicago truncatula]|uniref:F-box protein n=1 Tax=Medicago truncatula TaxID=3880 RepID=G7JWH3_MEDTR|nr:F-box protein SKIP23 [Medicago truncatula]AES96845.2 F-box protein [Medicago truncatula]RHN55448.1 hypothetical protein MtrunA17_Chr5g0417881 [Medicago truncatula]
MSLLSHCMPGRSLLKCGNEDWKVMTGISGSMGDIYIFKGRPYMVDETGRTVTVEPDSSVQLMDESLVVGGNMKFLVESEGDLLLADVYECVGVRFSDHDPVRIDFFKLDEKEKKWVKLTSLGDTVVLFLGMAGSFSISASDLCVSKGNCVIFMNNIFELEPFLNMDPVSFVLDLDEGQLTRLSDSPEYSRKIKYSDGQNPSLNQ